MRIPTLIKTSLATAAAAAVGSIAAAPGTRWYETLDKPAWQPPKIAFPLVWTPLYASLAIAGARAIDRADPDDRAALAASYGINLALNAGWTAVFFRAHRPRLALAEIVLLNASNLDLLRRTWKADRASGAAIAPYVAWTGFATALTASIARRNPDEG
jgi:translocator protein